MATGIVALQKARNQPAAKALRLLQAINKEHPNLALGWLEHAYVLDRLGREAEAVPLYKKAIRLGLRGNDLLEALVCLGSSLQTLGRHTLAVTTLRRALKLFPNDLLVKYFLCIALCSAERPMSAVRLLAEDLLTRFSDPRVVRYELTIRRKLRLPARR